ncbi:MAG: hypothetical protein PHC66_03735 [Candidatus Nanoarchaeia archaeon]|nr:hypothetical protein [Candidatus Nanoarchaeia archaeon]MDD5239206.1 hypothetical protein [Candidatus Nanoarchaeia archaeon]
MSKAAIELSMSTIVMLALFVIVVMIIVVIGIMISSQGASSVENITNIGNTLVPGA